MLHIYGLTLKINLKSLDQYYQLCYYFTKFATLLIMCSGVLKDPLTGPALWLDLHLDTWGFTCRCMYCAVVHHDKLSETLLKVLTSKSGPQLCITLELKWSSLLLKPRDDILLPFQPRCNWTIAQELLMIYLITHLHVHVPLNFLTLEWINASFSVSTWWPSS